MVMDCVDMSELTKAISHAKALRSSGEFHETCFLYLSHGEVSDCCELWKDNHDLSPTSASENFLPMLARPRYGKRSSRYP